MKKIPLTHDLFAIVDDIDFERMNRWNWHVLVGYKSSGRQTTARIVTEGMGDIVEFGHYLAQYDKDKWYLVFKNHNKLDFRRENLKLIPIEYARYHADSFGGSSSKYKGVYWESRKQRYTAYINFNGQKIYAGTSQSEDEAGRMYNAKAYELLGEYAFQNIIGEDNRKQDILLNPTSNARTRKTPTPKAEPQYRGLTERHGKYSASIRGEFLGTFETIHDAAYAYNQRAKELFGEKAILNPVPKGYVGKPRMQRPPITVFGKPFETLKEVADYYGYDAAVIAKRAKKMSLEEAVTTPVKFKLIENGKRISLRAVAAEHNVNRKKLSEYVKKGHSIEKAIAFAKEDKRLYESRRKE